MRARFVIAWLLAACGGAPPRAPAPEPPPPARARPSWPAEPWTAARCAPGAAFATLRAACVRPDGDVAARFHRALDAWRTDDARTTLALEQAAVDVVCAPPEPRVRRHALSVLIDHDLERDAIRAAAITADLVDELAVIGDDAIVHAHIVGLALPFVVLDPATPIACATRLRTRIDHLHARACELASPRRFRQHSPACLELGAIRCAIAAGDAAALAARGEHQSALAIYEELAFAPAPGCTPTRGLGERAVQAAYAAGLPDHARVLHQRTVDELGYPVILRASPYGHRVRPKPPRRRR